MSLKDENSADAANVSEPDLSTCGVNYCPAVPDASADDDAESTEESDNFSATPIQLYILAGVYLACSLAAALTVALFVTPLTE